MSVPPIVPLQQLGNGQARPEFSVMIPVHRPTAHFEVALQSVLRERRDLMNSQIAVVVDGPEMGIDRRVRALDPEGRVEIHALGGPVGIAQNLNRSIGLARGHLVHLLHQDDLVLPGFYARMRRAFEAAPMLGMAFCRAMIVDEAGDMIRRTSVPRLWSGVVRNWVGRIATRQRVQAPCAVVARSVYEHVGGFREDLRLALDWEMWVRIAVRYPVWCEVRALAAYRRHAVSTTERLRIEGAAWPDICQAIRINLEHCLATGHVERASASAAWYRRSALREARREAALGRHDRAGEILRQSESLLELVASQRLRNGLMRRATSVGSMIGARAAQPRYGTFT
jgi:hypothetical protein